MDDPRAIWGHEACFHFMNCFTRSDSNILDIGSGPGDHAEIFRRQGFHVSTCDLGAGQDYMSADYPAEAFDGIWCCHVLEHILDIQSFLVKVRHELVIGGLLAVTVPPAKHQIVGGHVSLWNAGLLLYRLILAGFDCRQASVGTYGYNISVLVRREDIKGRITLNADAGDIDTLSPYFPCPVRERFNGQLPNINW